MKYKLHARQLQQSYEMLGYFSVDDKLFLISIKLKYIVILRNSKLERVTFTTKQNQLVQMSANQ